MTTERLLLMIIGVLFADRVGLSPVMILSILGLVVSWPYCRAFGRLRVLRQYVQRAQKWQRSVTAYWVQVSQPIIIHVSANRDEAALSRDSIAHDPAYENMSLQAALQNPSRLLGRRFAGVWLNVQAVDLLEKRLSFQQLEQSLRQLSERLSFRLPVVLCLVGFPGLPKSGGCEQYDLEHTCQDQGLLRSYQRLLANLQRKIYAEFSENPPEKNRIVFQEMIAQASIGASISQLARQDAYYIQYVAIRLQPIESRPLKATPYPHSSSSSDRQRFGWRWFAFQAGWILTGFVPLSSVFGVNLYAWNNYRHGQAQLQSIAHESTSAWPPLIQLENRRGSIIRLTNVSALNQLLMQQQRNHDYQKFVAPLLHHLTDQLQSFQSRQERSVLHYRLWKYMVILLANKSVTTWQSKFPQLLEDLNITIDTKSIQSHLSRFSAAVKFASTQSTYLQSRLAISQRLLSRKPASYYTYQAFLSEQPALKFSQAFWDSHFAKNSTQSLDPYLLINPFSLAKPHTSQRVKQWLSRQYADDWLQHIVKQISQENFQGGNQLADWGSKADHFLQTTLLQLQHQHQAYLQWKYRQQEKQVKRNIRTLDPFYEAYRSGLLQLQSLSENWMDADARVRFQQNPKNAYRHLYQMVMREKKRVTTDTVLSALFAKLMQPLDVFWHLFSQQLVMDFNADWQKEIYTPYQQNLSTVFPYALTGLSDASFSVMYQLFGQQQSLLNTFSRRHPQVVYAPNRRLGHLYIPQKYQRQIQCFRRQIDLLFPNHHREVQVPFELYPYPNPDIEQLTIDFGGVHYQYANTPQHWHKLIWQPSPQLSFIQATSVDGRHDVYLEASGAWGFWHLLKRARVILLKPHVYQIRYRSLKFDLKFRSDQDFIARYFRSACALPEQPYRIRHRA